MQDFHHQIPVTAIPAPKFKQPAYLNPLPAVPFLVFFVWLFSA
ncbi:hypothetical protein D1BOALGB6SA_2844 [Olavius sp. associated proteobacterium Delta 1]|nr:hypothetical protein D1BOALGB6SA_2844 [Olavius sp. associated proteobacterium Delta 1]